MIQWARSLLLTATLAAGASTAQAELEICNETEVLQSVAIGYKGEKDWTSEGWWNIDPGACVTVVDGDLKLRYYYYFSEAADREFRGQSYFFCVEDSEFTIIGDTDCEARGYQDEDFREIDTGQTATEYTLTLVDEPPSETPRAPEDGSFGSAEGPGGINGGPVVADHSEDTRVTGAEGTQSTGDVVLDRPVTVSPEDLSTGIAPGRYGDAFATEAVFQGCELADGAAFCGFHTDEVKLRAFYSGPTPDPLLYALEELPVNTAVQIEGDLMNRRPYTAEVVVREVVPVAASGREAAMRETMQGDWVLDQDDRVEITVRGAELYERYNGNFRGAKFLRLADTCAGAASGPVMIQVSVRKQSQTCYEILDLTQTRMDLRRVGRAQRMTYRRVD